MQIINDADSNDDVYSAGDYINGRVAQNNDY